MPRPIPIVLLALLAFTPLYAEEPAPPPANLPPPPPIVEGDAQEETFEPDVVIRKEEGQTVEEYRIHGQLYMIRVTPSVGKPYYLVDADGDGKLESRRFELDPDVMVPAWTIFRW